MTAGMAPAARSDPLVSARGIGVRLGERWIFRYVDLQVLRGALVFLIGANGAGKSTCAKAVLGLIAIDEGKVERLPAAALGYVPQRLSISPTLPLTLRRLMTLTGRYSVARSTRRSPPSDWRSSAIRPSRRSPAASSSACCWHGR